MNTIKMHNVVKKLDQFACINPIEISNNVITATINGTMIEKNIKEIQSSFPGWQISFGTKNGRAALIIEEEKMSFNDIVDSMAYAFMRENQFSPFPPKNSVMIPFPPKVGRIIKKRDFKP